MEDSRPLYILNILIFYKYMTPKLINGVFVTNNKEPNNHVLALTMPLLSAIIIYMFLVGGMKKIYSMIYGHMIFLKKSGNRSNLSTRVLRYEHSR